MKTKVLISCAITAQLICVFVFAYAKKNSFLMTWLTYYTGQTVEGNLLGVYGQGEYIGVAGLMVGYGIWADGMQAAQADRGSGRLRYLSTCGSEEQIRCVFDNI